jgi:hypothetical protein
MSDADGLPGGDVARSASSTDQSEVPTSKKIDAAAAAWRPATDSDERPDFPGEKLIDLF